jgi:general secretion pathway protein D
MEMIRQIHRPPPQVMIQCLIAEVALDDNVEFGMEWAIQDLSFTESAYVGPNGVIKGDGYDKIMGVDVGAGGAAGAFGGFTFSITGEDFSFLLRALQSDGVLQVLSRPTILVANNEEANITIGDRVPFVRSSSVTDSGQVNSVVEYEEVGIILDVVPHINPDGYVNLEIHPEISQLNPSGSGVQISEGLTAPTFSERSADTVVTVKDGETIVIGGLINTREDQREVKVPIIGDIPIIGLAFRSTTSQRQRKELLIVLTVDVLRDEFDTYQMSVDQRDKSGFLTPEILESPLMEGLRIRPDDAVFGPDAERGLRPRQQRPGQQVPTDRELYGPTPDVYGPPRPERIKVEHHEVEGEIAQVYGPTPPARLVAATAEAEP